MPKREIKRRKERGNEGKGRGRFALAVCGEIRKMEADSSAVTRECQGCRENVRGI